MQGVDLITEGTITPGKVASVLEDGVNPETLGRTPSANWSRCCSIATSQIVPALEGATPSRSTPSGLGGPMLFLSAGCIPWLMTFGPAGAATRPRL